MFKVKDWNYYEKVSKFEELALTNNGLESFHQMIKSQLRRITPSFTGFIEVLGRVETLRKCDYEQDRQSGDPQYNRCWPATKIMKELYCKEIVEKQKKKAKTEHANSDDEVDYINYDNNLKDQSHRNRLELNKLEREINMIFEEFEEESKSFLKDSRKRKAERDYREIENELAKWDKNVNNIKSQTKFDIFHSFIQNDRPALLKQIENAKQMKVETIGIDKARDERILNTNEFKNEISDILQADIQKKAKKKKRLWWYRFWFRWGKRAKWLPQSTEKRRSQRIV